MRVIYYGNDQQLTQLLADLVPEDVVIEVQDPFSLSNFGDGLRDKQVAALLIDTSNYRTVGSLKSRLLAAKEKIEAVRPVIVLIGVQEKIRYYLEEAYRGVFGSQARCWTHLDTQIGAQFLTLLDEIAAIKRKGQGNERLAKVQTTFDILYLLLGAPLAFGLYVAASIRPNGYLILAWAGGFGLAGVFISSLNAIFRMQTRWTRFNLFVTTLSLLIGAIIGVVLVYTGG